MSRRWVPLLAAVVALPVAARAQVDLTGHYTATFKCKAIVEGPTRTRSGMYRSLRTPDSSEVKKGIITRQCSVVKKNRRTYPVVDRNGH